MNRGNASEKASLGIIVGIIVGVSALLSLAGMLLPASGLGGARAASTCAATAAGSPTSGSAPRSSCS